MFEEFTEGRIDATMTTTGLQLVQDARQACAQGDPNACRRMELIESFIQGVGHTESAERGDISLTVLLEGQESVSGVAWAFYGGKPFPLV